MRLIDLKCVACGTVFEELIRRDEDIAEIPCPSCQTLAPERQLSATAFIGRGGSSGSSAGSCSPGGRFS